MKPYRVVEGGIHDLFRRSRKKIRLLGGGFANGKTTSLVVLALEIARDYPGINMLLGRSTYPKLNDTLRKEFLDWCPKTWIESGPSDRDNTVYLKNGSIINFRYIAQQGKTKESTTSNLLSATYGFIGIDQLEDPEIMQKDFTDLMGRLRQQTRYIGTDPTMPKTGPRWMVLTCNPTANWVYKKLVRPVHRHKLGIPDKDLICDPKTKEPWIDIFESSTYENAHNLAPDYIEGLEATYTGQMRERYLLGKWASFEGLVYPTWDESVHLVAASEMEDLFDKLSQEYDLNIVEGYDFGQAVPSCYLYAWTDPWNNVHIMDGFYAPELAIKDQAQRIKEIRDHWGVAIERGIYADPSIFRRSPGGEGARGVGPSVAATFQENGVRMIRGNNAILNGIVKVNSYLISGKFHENPYDGTAPAPRLYISSKLGFVANEASEYYWRRNTEGEFEDVPQDRNDHAMDTIKYLLTDEPAIPGLSRMARARTPKWMQWNEQERVERTRSHRYRSL